MIALTIAGTTWQLDEAKNSIASVAERLEKHSGRDAWFFLANGNTLHLRLSQDTTYAIETDARE